MAPVIFESPIETDLLDMKFLVLALCVCAASAASFGYQPRRVVQPAQQVGQAFAQAVVTAPEAAYRAFEQPAVQVASTPVAVAKSVAYTKTTSANDEANAAVVRSESDVAADGFNYVFETQNGISAQSSGTLKKVGDSDVLAIQGSFQYVSPDGSPVQFSYIADENGYQPKSDLLPVGPAIPEYIIRALEYIRTHPQKP